MNVVGRIGGVIVVASALLVACTFTRNLDYLQNGAEPGTSTSSSSGSTTSSTSGGIDSGIVGQLLVPQLLNPANLIQDDANLFWTTDDNRVMRVAKTGGAPKELAKLTGDVGAVTCMTIDPQGGTLFLLIDGAVKTLSRDGGAPGNFLPGPDVMSIVADDTYLFTLSNDTATGGAIFRRYPKANAAQPTVISPAPNANEAAEGAVAAYKDSVYWTVTDENATGILYEQPKNVAAGVAPKVWKHTGISAQDKLPVGISVTNSEALAVDDDGIYWIDDANTVPYRLLRTQMQADAPALLNIQTSKSTAITVDAKYIYVLDGKNVIRITKTKTDERQVYSADESSTEIINDATSLYYLFTGDGVKATGGIYKLPKQ